MGEPTVTAGLEPRAAVVALREAAAASPTAVMEGMGMVYVLGYAECERLLHDHRLRGVGLSLFDLIGVPDGALRDWYGSIMFTNEGDAHHRMRRLVAKAFTPTSVERLRPLARATVAARLAGVHDEADLVAVFDGLPMTVMCALLGVPLAAVAEVIDWVDALSPTFGFMSPEQIVAAEGAITLLQDRMAGIVDQRAAEPGDDLISALLAVEDAGDTLTRAETVAMATNLLVGGHDTTASQLGCTMLELLQHPDAVAAAAHDPAVVSGIVNETLRMLPGLSGVPRVALEPIEVGGIERAAGTLLLLTTVTANRDPQVWDAPDEFRPTRFLEPGAPKLLTFGAGPHYCLGAALARMTLQEAVAGVVAMAPTLAEDASTIPWATVLGSAPVRVPVSVRSPGP